MIEIIGGILAIVIGVTTVWKVVIKPLYRLHVSIMETIKTVKEELRPNGGASIKDTVNRVEAMQLQSEMRFRNFVELLTPKGAALFEANSAGYLIWVSKNFRKATGKTMEELLGASWILTVSPEQRDVIYTKWKEIIRDGRSGILEYTGVGEDEIFRKFVMRVSPIRIDNQVHGFVGNVEIEKIDNDD